jgi:hypothetical protein
MAGARYILSFKKLLEKSFLRKALRPIKQHHHSSRMLCDDLDGNTVVRRINFDTWFGMGVRSSLTLKE